MKPWYEVPLVEKLFKINRNKSAHVNWLMWFPEFAGVGKFSFNFLGVLANYNKELLKYQHFQDT